MSAQDKAKSIAWQVEYHAKALAGQGEALRKMVEEIQAAAIAASEDAFGSVDFAKPIPALTPAPDVDCDWSAWPTNQRPPRIPEYLAAMTDEQVSAAEAALAPFVKRQQQVQEHNAKVMQRWSALLTAHGVGMVKRTDVKAAAIESVREKFRTRPYTRTVPVVLGELRSATGALAGSTMREFCDAARAKVAATKAAEERAARERQEAAEERTRAFRAEQEARVANAEAARLAEELRKATGKKTSAQSTPEPTYDSTGRIRNLELE